MIHTHTHTHIYNPSGYLHPPAAPISPCAVGAAAVYSTLETRSTGCRLRRTLAASATLICRAYQSRRAHARDACSAKLSQRAHARGIDSPGAEPHGSFVRVRFNPRLTLRDAGSGAASLGTVTHRARSAPCAASASPPSARRWLPVHSSSCTHTPIRLALRFRVRDISAVQPPPVQRQRIASQRVATWCNTLRRRAD